MNKKLNVFFKLFACGVLAYGQSFASFSSLTNNINEFFGQIDYNSIGEKILKFGDKAVKYTGSPVVFKPLQTMLPTNLLSGIPVRTTLRGALLSNLFNKFSLCAFGWFGCFLDKTKNEEITKMPFDNYLIQTILLSTLVYPKYVIGGPKNLLICTKKAISWGLEKSDKTIGSGTLLRNMAQVPIKTLTLANDALQIPIEALQQAQNIISDPVIGIPGTLSLIYTVPKEILLPLLSDSYNLGKSILTVSKNVFFDLPAACYNRYKPQNNDQMSIKKPVAPVLIPSLTNIDIVNMQDLIKTGKELIALQVGKESFKQDYKDNIKNLTDKTRNFLSFASRIEPNIPSDLPIKINAGTLKSAIKDALNQLKNHKMQDNL